MTYLEKTNARIFKKRNHCFAKRGPNSSLDVSIKQISMCWTLADEDDSMEKIDYECPQKVLLECWSNLVNSNIQPEVGWIKIVVTVSRKPLWMSCPSFSDQQKDNNKIPLDTLRQTLAHQWYCWGKRTEQRHNWTHHFLKRRITNLKK